MADKVRGITIELSADASGVISGLKQINSAVRDTQKQLKDVNRLLKLDPTNMTLLKQKTQLLQQQIANTKDKLTELKKAEADMRANGVDENSEQFQALQREIIATEQELKKLENTAGSGSAKLLQVSEVTQKLGDGLESAGKKLMPLTAGIAALGAGAVAAFKEVDEGADIVIKKTGATGEAAEELMEIYEEVSVSVVGSFEEIGKAVGEINTRFGITGAELEALAEEFMKFAKVNDQDVESAITGVDHAMKTFGLETEDAKGVLGLFTDISQKTGISVDTLESLLQSSGATLKELGLDLGESASLMGNFEAAGIDSNAMMSKLSKAAGTFSKKGLDVREGLQDLITRLQDSSEEAEATAESYTYFGTKGALAFIKAAKEGKLSFDNLSKDLKSYEGVVDKTYNSIISETDKMELIWKQTKVTLADAGKQIMTMLAPAIQKLANFVKELSQKWKNLDDGTKNTVIKIAGIVAAIAPMLIALGKVSKAISAITKVMSTMRIMSIFTNPITLAAAAVTGLAAGLAILVTKIEDSNNPLIEYRDKIKEVTDQNNELAAAIENTTSQMEADVEQSQVEADAAGRLADQLDALMQKEEKTAADKELILALVQQLNDTVPDLALAYDAETDSLNRTNDQIRANIELRKQQGMVDAYSAAYKQSLEEQAQAQIQLAEAQELFNEMYSNSSEELQEFYDNVKKYGLQGAANLYENGSEMIWKYESAVRDLDKADRSVTVAQKNVTEATKNTDRIYALLEDQTEELANEQKSMAKELNALDLAAFRDEVAETLGENFTTELNDAINNAGKAGVEIPDELKKGILSGEIPVKDATKKINDMVKKTLAENKANASKAGTDTGTSFSSSLSGQKSKAKEAALDNVNSTKAGLNEGVAPAGGIGSNTGYSYNSGVASQSGGAYSAGKALDSEARRGASGTGYNEGHDFGIGYANGIGSTINAVSMAAAAIAQKAIDKVKEVQRSGSPSRITMQEGENFGDGYTIGILDTVKDAIRAAGELASGAIGGLTDYSALNSGLSIPGAVSTGYTALTGKTATGSPVTAGSVVNNNYTQNNYSPKALTASEIYRQTNNLIALKGVLA